MDRAEIEEILDRLRRPAIAYDLANHLLRETTIIGTTTSHTYDPTGNRATRTYEEDPAVASGRNQARTVGRAE